ncbi:hypothetical protein B0H34DRAFT_807389 [Crassisporium funariophilum]|nr:hypothetical protein B0H34DRAFT_807389 [Crassisporium funariophilum]
MPQRRSKKGQNPLVKGSSSKSDQLDSDCDSTSKLDHSHNSRATERSASFESGNSDVELALPTVRKKKHAQPVEKQKKITYLIGLFSLQELAMSQNPTIELHLPLDQGQQHVLSTLTPTINITIEEKAAPITSSKNGKENQMKENRNDSDNDSDAKDGEKKKKKKKANPVLPGNEACARNVQELWKRWQCSTQTPNCIGGHCYVFPDTQEHLLLNTVKFDV